MPTLLFGSISTLADTSELQRASFNQAFDESGLDWNWDRDAYAAMLVGAGGAQRVADYAESRSETVDAAAVHEAKTRIFQEKLRSTSVPARSGVVDAVRAARSRGDKVGLVTTTAPENVSTLLDALGPDLGRDSFDVVVDASQVPRVKPDAAAYALALSALGVSAERSVALEDNVQGVTAAVAAGVTCVAFPNANTAGHTFPGAAAVVDHVNLAELDQLVKQN